jgi:hypothetical protein
VSVTGITASATSGAGHLPGAVVAAGAGLAAGLAIAAYDEIAELIAPWRRASFILTFEGTWRIS